jgi:molybdate/tungstate transport system substrate-binding protein
MGCPGLSGSTRILIFITVVTLAFSTGCSPREESERLSVFIAGSLVVPFAEVERVYEELHPEVDVQIEAYGSIQVIRHVTEIHDQIDVVIPADYGLIPKMMYTATDPETGLPYAEWTIQWAGNHLGLAFIPESRYADEITTQNWYEIIARPDVLLGLADPRFDAAGYRTLMIGQLAENFYDAPTIFERIFLGGFSQPIQTQKDSGRWIIHVPEILEISDTSNIVMRGGSVELLALLESHDIDYTFQYKSVALQHGLSFVELPPALSLGDPAYADDYASVQVKLDFKRFSSVNSVFDGETIAYGLTIPTNAPNPVEAQSFVEFLLGPQGIAIMENNSYPVFEPPLVDHYESLPENLKAIYRQ